MLGNGNTDRHSNTRRERSLVELFRYSAICDAMLSQIAMEMVENIHISSSMEQNPGNVLEHVETQRFLDYIVGTLSGY